MARGGERCQQQERERARERERERELQRKYGSGVAETGLTQGLLLLPTNILNQFSEPQSFSL